MKIVYSEHFNDRLKYRKKTSPVPLTIELVESAILNPDFVIPDPGHPNREWRVKKIGGRCLKVIVEIPEERDKLIAITVMFDRALKRKGLCE